MFFFKKKKQETPVIEEAKPAAQIKEPTQSTPAVNPIQKDNYGEKDNNEQFVNTAGKIGKAQHNYFRDLEKVQKNDGNRSISR